MHLLNAFSLNMMPGDHGELTIRARRLDAAEAIATAGAAHRRGELSSAVGHAETARLFAAALGLPIPCRRSTVTLERGTSALVGQYVGPRLPEGATALPEGARIDWFLVSVS